MLYLDELGLVWSYLAQRYRRARRLAAVQAFRGREAGVKKQHTD